MKYSSEASKNLYDGKFFYIIDGVTNTVIGDEFKTELRLRGPFDNIYYLIPANGHPKSEIYDFVQIVDGRPRTFTKEEILITDRKL
jgi:hypothetical protein